MVVTQSHVDEILERIDKNSTFGVIDPVEASTGKPLNTTPPTMSIIPNMTGDEGRISIKIKRGMSRNNRGPQEFKLQMNLDHYKIKDGDDEKRKQ